MNERSFFHSNRFNCWLIIAFFQLLTGCATIGAVVCIHAIGTAAGEELGMYAPPAKRTIEAPKPDPRLRALEGIPVAFRVSRAGP